MLRKNFNNRGKMLLILFVAPTAFSNVTGNYRNITHSGILDVTYSTNSASKQHAMVVRVDKYNSWKDVVPIAANGQYLWILLPIVYGQHTVSFFTASHDVPTGETHTESVDSVEVNLYRGEYLFLLQELIFIDYRLYYSS